ncbi:hypothetical protein BJ170DRAFT_43695 [Xylariales sp. AK1849]|nr:hypothetical protein BJ170DRAFT_43695 [Xylariales sp. AK1849]
MSELVSTMSCWLPGSSTPHDGPDLSRGHSALVGDNFVDHHFSSSFPHEDPYSLEDTSTTHYLRGMIKLEEIDHQSQWETHSSNTSPSDHTQQSETVIVPPPARHRTSSRKRRNTSSSSTASSVVALSVVPSEIGREKNRIAASKCRRKKKNEEAQLEERRRALQVQNAILSDLATALRNEVLMLKNEILRHGTCDFPPIQSYIETAASRIR